MLTQNFYSLIPILALAILPSLIWLLFYLKEDPHPEPRYWLFAIFTMGIALAPLVISLEAYLSKFFNFFISNQNGILLIVVIAPLVEELAKYGVVHLTLNKNPVLDEPVDGMIYVIVAALGFAAIENVFAIFSFVSPGLPGYFGAALNFVSLRFISAVALHGLASGIAGYFFAYYYFIKRETRWIVLGLAIATILHGLYNFFITRGTQWPMFATGILLGGAAVLVVYLFNRLKHYKVYQEVEL